jgi:hypothetical protein
MTEQKELNATIPISMIANMTQIIEVSTRRGAFRAEELTQVGSVFDQLAKLMAEAKAIMDKAAADGAAADGSDAKTVDATTTTEENSDVKEL